MTFVAIDFETANHAPQSICAAGIATFHQGQLSESLYWLVRPPKGFAYFRPDFTDIHGLTYIDVQNQPEFPAIAPTILDRINAADAVTAHNASFDNRVLTQTLLHFNLRRPTKPWLCTLHLARHVWPSLPNRRLPTLISHIGRSLNCHPPLSSNQPLYSCGSTHRFGVASLQSEGEDSNCRMQKDNRVRMGESNSIINLGELSKPATVLIERISDAVGGVFRPYQIRRVAQAEADATKIAAKSKIEITQLHQRALHRFLLEEAKKQQNIEEITAKALPQLPEKAAPEKLEDDWIANFFDKCRLISDDEMQTLWSKVLAGEATSPGTFSKRTVNFISSLEKSDAQLFQTLCSFGWGTGCTMPLILDPENAIYTDAGITFNTLTHLDSIGLLRFESLGGFARRGLPKHVGMRYFNTHIGIEFPSEKDNQLQVGAVLLTQVGAQLAPISGCKPNPRYLEYVLNHWSSLGLAPFSPLPQQCI